MDQRKFISFLMLSVLVMMLFGIMFPPPPKAPPGADAPVAAVKDDGKDVADAEDIVRDPDVQPAEAGAPRPERPVVADPEVAIAAVENQFVTLGSLDRESGYRMLVTLTNTGAAVHRAELSSSRYRDQHDRSGYLGELELMRVRGGLRVQSVGPGTPAARAGIEIGDLIVGIGEKDVTPIEVIDEYNAVLADSRPGDQLTLHVKRGEEPPQPRTLKLVWRPFAVLRPELENFLMRGVEPPADFVDRPSFLMTLPHLNGQQLSRPFADRIAQLLENGNWEVAERNETSVAFRRTLPELNLEITKRYSLEAVPAEFRNDINFPGYHLKLEIEIHNTAETPQSVVYQLDGPTGMPLEGWWYAHKISRQRWFGAAGLRDIVVRFDGNNVYQIDCPQITEGDVRPMGEGQALAFAGVDGQFFAAVMIPERESLNEVWFDSVEAVIVGPPPPPRTPPTFTNVTCRLNRQEMELEAGGTHRESFAVFIGPKRPNLLRGYKSAGDLNHSLEDIVYYGLALFAVVARAMLGILHFFHGIVGNYGIAIILLTVSVRGLMFPISYKQTKNMARMQALKPEMDRITDKYKADMQKRSQAMQELYRKHQINPLGGCLPVFLQLPIFIGLYRALMVDVELRQSPLFGHAIRWVSNLSAPDMFLNWSPVMPDFINSGIGLFGLGPYLNLLPLVTVVLFLVTQKMAMPEPTNEQAALQQKMMKYMTMFIGVLFYKVASGLCLYFIASSLWGIAERKLLPKSQVSTESADGTSGGSPAANGKRPSDSGPNGRPPGKKRSVKARRKK